VVAAGAGSIGAGSPVDSEALTIELPGPDVSLLYRRRQHA
jgi:hypothetical protein